VYIADVDGGGLWQSGNTSLLCGRLVLCQEMGKRCCIRKLLSKKSINTKFGKTKKNIKKRNKIFKTKIT